MDTIYQNWEYTGAITIPVGGKMDVWGSDGTPKFPLWPMPPRSGMGPMICYGELVFELQVGGAIDAIIGITYPTDAIAPTYPWLGKQHGGPRVTTAPGCVYYKRRDFIDPTTPQDYPAGYAVPGFMWAMKADANGHFPSYSPIIHNLGTVPAVIGNIAYYAEARPL